MCEKCFTQEIHSFPAYWDFDEFYNDFNLKLNTETGLKLLRSDSFIADIYECQNCHTIWWLAMPDNSWRGFFLKESSGELRLKNMEKEAKEKGELRKKGCLIFTSISTVILLILIGVTYFVTK